MMRFFIQGYQGKLNKRRADQRLQDVDLVWCARGKVKEGNG